MLARTRTRRTYNFPLDTRFTSSAHACRRSPSVIVRFATYHSARTGARADTFKSVYIRAAAKDVTAAEISARYSGRDRRHLRQPAHNVNPRLFTCVERSLGVRTYIYIPLRAARTRIDWFIVLLVAGVRDLTTRPRLRYAK